MAQVFPEYSDLQAAYLLEFESRIGQDSPLNNKAFLRILSKVLAMIAVILRVEVVGASKENLAISASLNGLKLIGQEYDVDFNDAVPTVLTADIVFTAVATIPANKNFVSPDTGVIYYTSTSLTSAGSGTESITLTARTAGAIGNLTAGQELNIQGQIAGVAITAEVTAITTTGADEEETETYRQRVLDVIRAPGGGGNSADYRNWAQEQEGVVRAYPYSGNPTYLGGGGGAIDPPDRTVYIECATSIDPDGIPGTTLLNNTKDTIITDPETGLHRQPLGLTNDTLYVVAISRTTFYVQITNADFQPGTEVQVRADIDDALDQYFLNLEPFIAGLDVDEERNDLITNLSVARVAQQILFANNASAESILFGIMPGSFIPTYQLGSGEKAKFFGTVTYV